MDICHEWITIDFRDKLSRGNLRVSGGQLGRPRQNWKDVVKKELGKMGISWDEVEEAAEDVLLWRTGVLTEGFPLLFDAPFSIVNCVVICIMLTFC